MLINTVTAYTYCAILSHIFPEVICSHTICSGSIVLLINSLEANILRHLGVGMATIKECSVERLHAVEHCLMTVSLGSSKVFGITKELIGIEHTLVHAAVLCIEHCFHVGITELCHDIHTPVGKFAEHLLSQFAASIKIGIAQTSQYLMLTIEWHPASFIPEIVYSAIEEGAPYACDRLTANKTIESLGVVIVCLLAVVHYLKHIFHALFHSFFHGFIGCSGISQRQCRQVMTAHMTVKIKAIITPVDKRRMGSCPFIIFALSVCGISKS